MELGRRLASFKLRADGRCHGIVTAYVLVQGLSRGAIATRKLKGVNRDSGHEDYTGSAPYGEGKSLLQLRWNYLGFRWPGSLTAMPGYRSDVASSEPPPGRLFI